MLKSEANIQNEILMELSKQGCLVWRQDTGAYKDPKSGRLVRYGLCKGSSDVIGAIPVEITQDMVGKTVAIFGAWEVKTATGRIRPSRKCSLPLFESLVVVLVLLGQRRMRL